MKYWIILTVVTVGLLVAACGSSAPAEAPAAPTEAPVVEAPTEAPAADASAAVTETTTTEAAPAEATGPVELPVVDPLAVTGNIIVAGSSTVFPLTERIAERFQSEGYGDNITIDSIGTGGGFERFCKEGASDIANASRPIRDSEVENCTAINRTPVEFRVGTDALAVVVNPANTWAADMTVEQLCHAFSADFANWSDIDPNWPAEPIRRYSPGTDSGTYDYFIEAVMAPCYPEEGKGEEMFLKAANLQQSEDDNVLVQGVAGDANSIGYFGFAYYTENSGSLTDVTINGVTPDAATVEDGSYALARPLFIYSDPTVMKDKPQVADFINFYLTYVNEEIDDVGYFPASEAALNQARQNWLTAVGQ